MQVKDVLSPAVDTAHPDDLIRDASAKMKAVGVDPFPVTENGRLVGLLSSGAVQERLKSDGLAAGMVRVSEVMSGNAFSCRPDQDAGEALQAADAASVTGEYIPVVDAAGSFLGLASLSQLRRADPGADDGTTAVESVNAIESLIDFDQDRVEYMSDASFPASDPPAPMAGEADRPEGGN